MPFQFMCPHGHLLEGVESMMGQQSQCPVCGAAFVVPVVNSAGPGMPGQSPYYPPGGAPGWQQPGSGPPAGYGAYPDQGYGGGAYPGGYPDGGAGYPQPGPMPGVMPGSVENAFPPGPAGVPEYAQSPPAIAPPGAEMPPPATADVAAAPPEEPKEPEEERVVRILCPNSHELHTPMSMIGEEAMCPECGAQFRLRYEESLEYAEERRAAQALRDEAFNKAALKWSIVAAVVVVLALIIMVIIASM